MANQPFLMDLPHMTIYGTTSRDGGLQSTQPFPCVLQMG